MCNPHKQDTSLFETEKNVVEEMGRDKNLLLEISRGLFLPQLPTVVFHLEDIILKQILLIKCQEIMLRFVKRLSNRGYSVCSCGNL